MFSWVLSSFHTLAGLFTYMYIEFHKKPWLASCKDHVQVVQSGLQQLNLTYFSLEWVLKSSRSFDWTVLLVDPLKWFTERQFKGVSSVMVLLPSVVTPATRATDPDCIQEMIRVSEGYLQSFLLFLCTEFMVIKHQTLLMDSRRPQLWPCPWC